MGFSYGFRRAGVVALSLLAGVLTWTASLPSEAAAGCRSGVPGDGFGSHLVAGPMDDDAIHDRAITAREDLGYMGWVTVLLGSSDGLSTARYGSRASSASPDSG